MLTVDCQLHADQRLEDEKGGRLAECTAASERMQRMQEQLKGSTEQMNDLKKSLSHSQVHTALLSHLDHFIAET